jgi:hypothetical protein
MEVGGGDRQAAPPPWGRPRLWPGVRAAGARTEEAGSDASSSRREPLHAVRPASLPRPKKPAKGDGALRVSFFRLEMLV